MCSIFEPDVKPHASLVVSLHQHLHTKNKTMPTYPLVKHPFEARDSFEAYLERTKSREKQSGDEIPRRALKNHHHNDDIELESLVQQRSQEIKEQEDRKRQASIAKSSQKHDKRTEALINDSGISKSTAHGMMIDAGSGGSRMHVFEWNPRVLRTPHEVTECVAGKKLTYPDGDSRWTDRLSPGLSEFATKSDDELLNVSRLWILCTSV